VRVRKIAKWEKFSTIVRSFFFDNRKSRVNGTKWMVGWKFKNQ
jgi:hypothetical protein